MVGAAFLAGELGFGGDELATEGFGEDALGELVGAGGGDSLFDGVGEFEEGFQVAEPFRLCLSHQRRDAAATFSKVAALRL